MANLSRTLLLFSLCFIKFITAAGQCYFPNGDSTNGDFPCDPDADDSPCCHGGQGSACLTNKLCRGPDGNTIRGSCTDQDWESSECAHYCLSEYLAQQSRSPRLEDACTDHKNSSGANRGGTDLISCSNVTGIDTSYCCDHATNCCNSGVGRFDVLPSEPEVWATWNRESSQFVVVRTITEEPTESSTSSATSASTTSGAGPSSSDSSTAGPAGDSTQTSAQPTPSTLDPAPSTEEAQEDPGLSTAAKAGIGAGAGAGALLIAVVVFLLLKVRKSKKALQAQQTQHASHQWPGPYQQPPAPYVYYKGPAEGWQQPHAADGSGQAYNGKMEMDARPIEQHWARVELPANS